MLVLDGFLWFQIILILPQTATDESICHAASSVLEAFQIGGLDDFIQGWTERSDTKLEMIAFFCVDVNIYIFILSVNIMNILIWYLISVSTDMTWLIIKLRCIKFIRKKYKSDTSNLQIFQHVNFPFLVCFYEAPNGHSEILLWNSKPWVGWLLRQRGIPQGIAAIVVVSGPGGPKIHPDTPISIITFFFPANPANGTRSWTCKPSTVRDAF